MKEFGRICESGEFFVTLQSHIQCNQSLMPKESSVYLMSSDDCRGRLSGCKVRNWGFLEKWKNTAGR